MLVARIARPVALYGASVSAQTSETADETIVRPIDFEEFAYVYVAKLICANSYAHMPRFGGFNRKFPSDANRVNLLNRGRSTRRKPILRSIFYCICENRLRN